MSAYSSPRKEQRTWKEELAASLAESSDATGGSPGGGLFPLSFEPRSV